MNQIIKIGNKIIRKIKNHKRNLIENKFFFVQMKFDKRKFLKDPNKYFQEFKSQASGINQSGNDSSWNYSFSFHVATTCMFFYENSFSAHFN